MRKPYATPNKLIVAAVSPYLPCGHLRYDGKETNYAIFRSYCRPSVLASGINRAVTCYGFIDVFTDHDPVKTGNVVEQIVNSLTESGVIVQNINDGSFDPDLTPPIWHKEIEFTVDIEVI